MGKYVDYIKGNPVVLMDIVKYVLAGLVLFGLPIPPGIDVALAGLILAGLTWATRSKVVPLDAHNEAVENALNTPAPVEVDPFIDGPVEDPFAEDADPDATSVFPAP